MSWSLHPAKPVVVATAGITETVRRGMLSVSHLRESRIVQLAPEGEVDSVVVYQGKPEVWAAFSNNDGSDYLCVTSTPVNPDFSQTGALLYRSDSQEKVLSKCIKTTELGIEAVWNSESKAFLILDRSNSSIYCWSVTENDAVRGDLPNMVQSNPIALSLDPAGRFVFAYGTGAQATSSQLYWAKLTGKTLTWHGPISLPNAPTVFAAVDPTASRLLVISKDAKNCQVALMDLTGQLIDRRNADQRGVGEGLGWIDENTAISVGHDHVMVLDFQPDGPKPVPGGIKRR